jgi:hypothetical protein
MSQDVFDTIMGDCAEFAGRNMIRITEDMFEQQCDEWAEQREPVDEEDRELGLRGLAEYHKQALRLIEAELGDRSDRTYLIGEAWRDCSPVEGWRGLAIRFADTLSEVQFGHVWWSLEDDSEDLSEQEWTFVNDISGPDCAEELFEYL